MPGLFAQARQTLASFTRDNAPDLYSDTLIIPMPSSGALVADPITGNLAPSPGLPIVCAVRLMESRDPRVREMLGVDDHVTVFDIKWNPLNALEFDAIPYGTRLVLEYAGRTGTLTLVQPHLRGSGNGSRGYGLRILATFSAPKRG